MRKSVVQRAWPVLLMMVFSIIRHAAAQEWTVNLGMKNPLDVSIQNLNQVEAMMGVTVWADTIPAGWSITPGSVELDMVAPLATRTAHFMVSVAPGTMPGDIGTIRLRLTDDQGHTWTALEKAALEIEVEVGQTMGAVTRYGGAGTDTASVVYPTRDGGAIMAGQSNSYVKGKRTDQDLWIVKLDQAGEVTWHATYGGTGNAGASAILPTGTFTLTEKSFQELGTRLPLEELQFLEPLAGKTYHSQSTFLHDVKLYLVDDEYLYTVLDHAEYEPTGYIVAGTADGGLLWLLILTTEGSIEWQRVFTLDESLFTDLDFFVGASAYLTSHSLRVTNDGEYLVTGIMRTNLAAPSNKPFEYWVRDNSWVMKLDAQGQGNLWPMEPILSAGWDMNSNKSLYAIQETPYGDFFAVGAVQGHGWWLAKFNKNLSLMEEIYLGNGGTAQDIELTPEGDYLIVGTTNSAGTADAVLKTDGFGAPLWQKNMELPEGGYVSSIAHTTDNGSILGGTTDSQSWIVKLDAQGATDWEQRLAIGIAPDPMSVWQTADGLGYLTVVNHVGGNTADFALLKMGSAGELPCFGVPVSSASKITTDVTSSEANVTFERKALFLAHDPIFENPPQKMPAVAVNVLCGESGAPTAMTATSVDGSLAPAQSQQRLLTSAESTQTPTTIPEPATLALVGVGVLGLLLVLKRRQA